MWYSVTPAIDSTASFWNVSASTVISSIPHITNHNLTASPISMTSGSLPLLSSITTSQERSNGHSVTAASLSITHLGESQTSTSTTPTSLITKQVFASSSTSTSNQSLSSSFPITAFQQSSIPHLAPSTTLSTPDFKSSQNSLVPGSTLTPAAAKCPATPTSVLLLSFIIQKGTFDIPGISSGPPVPRSVCKF